MTDLEKFVALYESFGITCKVNTTLEGYAIFLTAHGSGLPYENETRSPKLNGYLDFYSGILFDSEGKFMEQGFWE